MVYCDTIIILQAQERVKTEKSFYGSASSFLVMKEALNTIYTLLLKDVLTILFEYHLPIHFSDPFFSFAEETREHWSLLQLTH